MEISTVPDISSSLLRDRVCDFVTLTWLVFFLLSLGGGAKNVNSINIFSHWRLHLFYSCAHISNSFFGTLGSYNSLLLLRYLSAFGIIRRGAPSYHSIKLSHSSVLPISNSPYFCLIRLLFVYPISMCPSCLRKWCPPFAMTLKLFMSGFVCMIPAQLPILVFRNHDGIIQISLASFPISGFHWYNCMLVWCLS